jgi:hypothetical protein
MLPFMRTPLVIPFLFVLCAILAPVKAQDPTERLRDELTKIDQSRAKLNQDEKSIREKLKRLEAPAADANAVPANAGDSEERLRGQLAEIQQVRAVLNKNEQFISEELKELKVPLDTIQGVSDICPVHNIRMRVRRAPIVYGLLIAYVPFDLRKRQFPFALKYWAGGCIVRDKSTALIYTCPECLRAEKHWISDHNQRQ